MKRPERWRGDCEGYSSEEMLEWIEYAEYLESLLLDRALILSGHPINGDAFDTALLDEDDCGCLWCEINRVTGTVERIMR